MKFQGIFYDGNLFFEILFLKHATWVHVEDSTSKTQASVCTPKLSSSPPMTISCGRCVPRRGPPM